MQALLAPRQDRFEVSVGGTSADLNGFDSETIQLAVDVAKAHGGGVVKLAAGVFDVYGPIRLHDNITLTGRL